MKEIKHLPYDLDEKNNRFHYYETLWKHKAIELLSQNCDHQIDGMTLFDYGCGRGETLKIAAQKGMITEGQDIDPECVERAKKHGKAEIMSLVEGRAVLPENKWDVVTCFHVLEHVDNPKAVLSDLAKASKEYVLIAVPNLQRIPNIRKPNELPPVNNGHLQSWDHPTFLNLAETQCGLELVSWGHDATILPVVSELCRKLLGQKQVIKLETGLFRKLFPFWGHSIIGLFRVAP
ncbi:MAG: class I SAM-dependent methyltransferase [Akkermansiaceae bacterium]